jgi:hypothetical protein
MDEAHVGRRKGKHGAGAEGRTIVVGFGRRRQRQFRTVESKGRYASAGVGQSAEL